MNYITYLHKREDIENLSNKERFKLLDYLIDNWIELRDSEKKYLTPEQNKRYTNKEFETKRWITPNEWEHSDETQKELFSYNSKRTTIYPKLFDSMDSEWRKNILFAVNILSGQFLNKDEFENLSDDEKKFYVNKKIIKTSSFFPFELPYLSNDNYERIINTTLNRNEDFTDEEKENFTEFGLKYYNNNKKKLNETKNIIKKILYYKFF
jgi:hypothetical protein